MRMSLFALLAIGTLSGAADPVQAQTQDGRLALVAGGGTGGDGGSGPTRSRLTNPFGVGICPDGTDHLCGDARRARPQDRAKDGRVQTVAGTGKNGDQGDGGPAAKAEFNGMHSLAVMKNGDILVSDTWNNRVRKIDAQTGTITTIAGTGKKGFSGDGGPATKADFGGIYCIALDEPGQGPLPCRPGQPADPRRRPQDGRCLHLGRQRSQGIPETGPMPGPRRWSTPGPRLQTVREMSISLDRGGNALRVVDRCRQDPDLGGDGREGIIGRRRPPG